MIKKKNIPFKITNSDFLLNLGKAAEPQSNNDE